MQLEFLYQYFWLRKRSLNPAICSRNTRGTCQQAKGQMIVRMMFGKCYPYLLSSIHICIILNMTITSVTRLFCQNPEEQVADVFSVLLNFSSYVCLSSGGTKWPPIKMTSKHHQKFPTNHKPFRISTNSHFDEFSHFPTCFIEFLD